MVKKKEVVKKKNTVSLDKKPSLIKAQSSSGKKQISSSKIASSITKKPSSPNKKLTFPSKRIQSEKKYSSVDKSLSLDKKPSLEDLASRFAEYKKSKGKDTKTKETDTKTKETDTSTIDKIEERKEDNDIKEASKDKKSKVGFISSWFKKKKDDALAEDKKNAENVAKTVEDETKDIDNALKESHRSYITSRKEKDHEKKKDDNVAKDLSVEKKSKTGFISSWFKKKKDDTIAEDKREQETKAKLAETKAKELAETEAKELVETKSKELAESKGKLKKNKTKDIDNESEESHKSYITNRKEIDAEKTKKDSDVNDVPLEKDKKIGFISSWFNKKKKDKSEKIDMKLDSISLKLREEKIKDIKKDTAENKVDIEKEKKDIEEKKEKIKQEAEDKHNRFLFFFKKKNKDEPSIKKKEVTEEEFNIGKIFNKELNKEKKKVTASERKRKLSEYLEKSGFEIGERKLKKIVFYCVLAMVSLLTIIYIFFAIKKGQSPVGLLLQALILWTLIFIFLYGLVWIIIMISLDMIMFRRKLEIEEVLPDFLQLTSANIRAGMTTDMALWSAVRPRFGVLAKEIEDVAKRTYTGEDLSTALLDFANKYDSPILLRSVNLINESIKVGGDVGSLLNKIALNIENLRTMKKQMAASVMTYVIFITFASIVAAPILFGLSHELLNIVQGIAGDVASGGGAKSGGGIGISINMSDDNIKIEDFEIFVYVCLTISSTFAAIIVATIRKGGIKEDLHYIPIYIAISLTIYFISSWFMGMMFAGM